MVVLTRISMVIPTISTRTIFSTRNPNTTDTLEGTSTQATQRNNTEHTQQQSILMNDKCNIKGYRQWLAKHIEEVK